MRRLLTLCLALIATLSLSAAKKKALWPDGTPMDPWFADTTQVDLNQLGRRYVVTDYGVSTDSTQVQTQALQRVIDRCASEGGGVVVVPRGTFLSGSLYFRQGTHLQVEEGGRLKGSDRIADFDLRTTRIEGETCTYYTALINADGLNGFVIAGPGTIDGQAAGCPPRFACAITPAMLESMDMAGKVKSGLIASGDIFVSRPDDITRILSLYPEAVAVDMESAAIAQVCYIKNVPFVCVRVVSDTPGAADNIAQYENFWEDAPRHTFETLNAIIAKI